MESLQTGRKHFEARDWRRAFDSLTNADAAAMLGAEDLRRLATSAYMLGLDEEYADSLRRAHEAFLERDDIQHAIRCAFWIGHSLMFRGQRTEGAGWFARANRLLDSMPADCVEHGYMHIPDWLQELGGGNFEAVCTLTDKAVRIGERFGDPDLVWLARDDQARALIGLGRIDDGLRLVDEALVAATRGELSPIVTGIVFCNTISFCIAAFELRRVREWTTALTRWCAEQPEMIAHNGLCLVHRAEIKLLGGDWGDALEEARQSAERFSRGALNRLASGKAHYCQGEAHRLRGDFVAAEAAYRRASQNGCEPQPGLALMRLAQGDADAASAAIRRIFAEATTDLRRAEILPAYVEIALAPGDLDRARAACNELDEILDRHDREVIRAMASYCRGALALAEARANDAVRALRAALAIWTDLDAPYEIARTRALIADACRALGDTDTAALEQEAAMRMFDALGAAHDAARVAAPASSREGEDLHGLTPRQVEVLRLVAAGKSNRDIADALFVSEHTVARHLQNVYAKLNVTSRAQATAFAFEHDLV